MVYRDLPPLACSTVDQLLNSYRLQQIDKASSYRQTKIAMGKYRTGYEMIKLMICARRKPGITHQEFDRYWLEKHGPLVKSVPEFIQHVRKYVQCHILTTAVPLGANSDYDGVAELWFDNVDELNKAFSEPRYLEIIRPDELKFADIGNCVSIVAEESLILG